MVVGVFLWLGWGAVVVLRFDTEVDTVERRFEYLEIRRIVERINLAGSVGGISVRGFIGVQLRRVAVVD